MVTQGAKAVIVVAEDGDAAAAAVEDAAKKGVKVIAYDRLIKSPKIAAYVSFDNVDVGRNQAKGVLAKVNKGNFVLLGGSPTDNNAHLFRAGQMEVLKPLIESGQIKVVADQWVENWDAAKARDVMENILTATGGKFDAVVASNDGTALGALEAMKAGRPGWQGPDLRPGRHRGGLQLHRPRRADRHDPEGHPQADPARLRARGQPWRRATRSPA